MSTADLAIETLNGEQATLLNELDKVAYGTTRAHIRERLQQIEDELDEIYAWLVDEKEQTK